jgi:hypothetical protein
MRHMKLLVTDPSFRVHLNTFCGSPMQAKPPATFFSAIPFSQCQTAKIKAQCFRKAGDNMICPLVIMTTGYSWENNRTLSGRFSSHVWLPRIHMPDPWFQHVSIPNLFQTPQATAKAAGYGHLGPELGVMRFSGWVSQISSWLLVKLRVLVILFCIYSILLSGCMGLFVWDPLSSIPSSPGLFINHSRLFINHLRLD